MSAEQTPMVIPGQLRLFADDQINAESSSAPAVQVAVTRPDIRDENGQIICVWDNGQYRPQPAS